MIDESTERRLLIARFSRWTKSHGWWYPFEGSSIRYREAPDYDRDLNACWDAEEEIARRGRWYEPLQRAVSTGERTMQHTLFNIAHATAAQRAKAIAATIREMEAKP